MIMTRKANAMYIIIIISWENVKYMNYISRPVIRAKPVISSRGIFVAIANNTLYGYKNIDCSFMPKIIRILSKDHVS